MREGSSEGGAARRIREAALALFSERGFAGTAMRDVAAAAGVSPGVVTYHYPRKADLFRAAFSAPYEAFVSDLLALVEDRTVPAGERLRRVIHRLARLSRGEVRMLRGIFREVLASPDQVADLLGEFVRRGHLPLLLRAIGEAVAEGAVPAGVGPGLLPLIVGGTVLPALLEHVAGAHLPDPNLPALLRDAAHHDLLLLLGLGP